MLYILFPKKFIFSWNLLNVNIFYWFSIKYSLSKLLCCHTNTWHSPQEITKFGWKRKKNYRDDPHHSKLFYILSSFLLLTIPFLHDLFFLISLIFSHCYEFIKITLIKGNIWCWMVSPYSTTKHKTNWNRAYYSQVLEKVPGMPWGATWGD